MIPLLKGDRVAHFPSQSITDTDYADDIGLLENTRTEAISQLHNMEQASGGIGLHVNADKTEYMGFIKKEDNSELNGGSLKQFFWAL